MPRLSDQMEEATVIRWLKGVGDTVVKGDELVEVETDKSTVVYEAETDGMLVEILVECGGAAALGAVIARLRLPGESADAARTAATPAVTVPTVAVARPGRPRATPVARRTAAELNIALDGVHGTGQGGRIVRADVRLAAAQAPATPPAASTTGFDKGVAETVALTATQRTIARRMVESKTTIPDFVLSAEIDMVAAAGLRNDLKALRPDDALSLNDLVVKAVAVALREFPLLNASHVDGAVVRHSRINVGIAVATDDALLVPAIFDADRKPLAEIARESRALAERARNRTITAAELTEGTFTVSNLGMFGIRSFTAVINPPQVAILAVGAVTRRAVVEESGAIVARERMDVSLSSDHRIVYGAEGARFLARVRELLERPLALTF